MFGLAHNANGSGSGSRDLLLRFKDDYSNVVNVFPSSLNESPKGYNPILSARLNAKPLIVCGEDVSKCPIADRGSPSEAESSPILWESSDYSANSPGFRDGDAEDLTSRPTARFQQSSWFKLPPNIRQDILRLAFGNKRLHMCLGFNMNGTLEDASANEPQVWSWCGCVCNRKLDKGLGPMTRGECNIGPWVDHCFNHDQGSYIRGEPTPKNVGVMGWLRSCRQNYAETIETLYSKNTIILSGGATIMHLDQLVQLQRLEVVTSLEIKCSLRWDSETFNEVLARLSPYGGTFPRLRRLYLSLEIALASQSLDPILESFDQLVRERSGLEECALALPAEWFRELSGRLCDKQTGQRITYNQIWRILGDITSIREPDNTAEGTFDHIQLPYVDSYPKPPYHLNASPGLGYWILEASNMPSNWELEDNLGLNGGYTGTDEWPF
ncbi:hypothetical protein FGRMN_3770 [Fusarium graminum]|nr:hypothetical protein FGRMN_3770 [Fusarium graminum]